MGLIGAHPVRLLLAIRAQPSFIVSTYTEAIRSDGFLCFDRYLGKADLSALRWSELVARILNVRPDLHVTVWQYEDYTERLPNILAACLGSTAAVPLDGLKMPEERIRPGLSGQAVDSIKAEQEALGRPLDRNRIEEIIAAFPKTPDCPAPQPLDLAQRQILEDNYSADLDALTKMSRVTLLG